MWTGILLIALGFFGAFLFAHLMNRVGNDDGPHYFGTLLFWATTYFLLAGLCTLVGLAGVGVLTYQLIEHLGGYLDQYYLIFIP